MRGCLAFNEEGCLDEEPAASVSVSVPEGGDDDGVCETRSLDVKIGTVLKMELDTTVGLDPMSEVDVGMSGLGGSRPGVAIGTTTGIGIGAAMRYSPVFLH